jgi:hypothetical protein
MSAGAARHQCEGSATMVVAVNEGCSLTGLNYPVMALVNGVRVRLVLLHNKSPSFFPFLQHEHMDRVNQKSKVGQL